MVPEFLGFIEAFAIGCPVGSKSDPAAMGKILTIGTRRAIRSRRYLLCYFFEGRSMTELGEFMGKVIAGIYQGIRQGAYDAPSDFERAAGRAHQAWPDYFVKHPFELLLGSSFYLAEKCIMNLLPI